MRKKYKYLVVISWSEQDRAYVAEVPELPGCATHGASLAEASRRVEDAIQSWMEGAKEAGYLIPQPIVTKKYSGKFVTRIDPQLHRRLALKSTEEGKSLNRFVEEVLREVAS